MTNPEAIQVIKDIAMNMKRWAERDCATPHNLRVSSEWLQSAAEVIDHIYKRAMLAERHSEQVD